MMTGNKVRPSTIEGIFYPAEKDVLSARLRDLLNHNDRDAVQTHTPYSIIVPHSAMDYSGAIAAAAYRVVANRKIKTVVLLGPVHRELEEMVILPYSQIFQTPLGSISVDEVDLKDLTKLSSSFRIDDIPHLEEHCLEAQLPFVQHLFPSARIVPILLGKPTRTLVQLLSESLWKLYADRIASTLFVVTANITSNTDAQKGRREADQVIEWIGDGNWRSLLEATESKRISSCGAGCLAVILQMNERLGGAISLLQQGSSLPKVRDPKKVVHYAAFVLQNG
ncbi:MAG: AmmeMemoRadiSam system protein B [Spirochaetaceae bacterium]|nr:MAG: AmmeMemoRadiSam system protein B [Spirochaetaceae bacterium]